MAVYADDVAILASGPTYEGPAVRATLQNALDAVVNHLGNIGLNISPEKTLARMVHPPPSYCKNTPQLHLFGSPLPWQTSVKYLGVTIDHALRWKTAVQGLRAGNRRITGYVARLLAGGEGISIPLARQLYEGIAVARSLYALPLVGVRAWQWEQLDADHRKALRRFAGLPNTSQVGPTYAELGAWPVSLRAERAALNHIERLHRAQGTAELIARLRNSPHSRMGHVARLFDEWTPLTRSIAPPALPPPHRNRPLSIQTELPRVRSKRDTPRCAILQEAAERLYGDYADRVVLYTDGSVMDNGESATASCAVPALGIERQCRVPHCPSSTVAELAGLHLAADIIAGQSRMTAVVIASDSRAALLQLRHPDRGTPCVANLSAKLCAVRDRGCDIVLQWVPSHIGLPGNEAANRLAKNAHGDSAIPESDAVTPFDVARNTIHRRLMARHPDPRVASGNPPRLISFVDFGTRARRLLLHIRVGCVWTAERRQRIGGVGDGLCADCGALETVDHLLRECPAFSGPRTALRIEYGELGLPSATSGELLFPAASAWGTRRALRHLIRFIDRAAITGRF
ncbi:hypothetical protein V5799_024104 [Amblyomma americanum]|uniref:Tick transposon n=1 Tax=Amblyomma americanum TaxID=6943 RepID=A0AAQ4ED30_AMBAM